MNYLKKVTLIVLPFLFLYQSPAYAYLDPGTGSYIFQIVAASLLSALYAIKMYWISIKTYIKSIFDKTKNKTNSDE